MKTIMKKSILLQILAIMLTFNFTNIAYAEKNTDSVIPNITVDKTDWGTSFDQDFYDEFYLHVTGSCDSNTLSVQVGDKKMNLKVDDSKHFDYRIQLATPDLFSVGPEYFSVILTSTDNNDPDIKNSITLKSPPMYSTFQYYGGKLTKADWSAYIKNNFGVVYLNVAGKYPEKREEISIDKISIATYGDGVYSEQDLSCDGDNNFDEKIGIQFTHAPSDRTFTSSTDLILHMYSDTYPIKVRYRINSDELKYNILKGTNKITGNISTAYSDNSTSVPLWGYNVELDEHDTIQSTEYDGSFTFKNIPNGIYTLKITGSTCLTKKVTNVIVQDSDVRISSKDSPILLYQGDFNGDNVINMIDVIQIGKVFNSKNGDANYNYSYDIHKDNAINMLDIMILAKNFNMIGD